MRNFLIKWWQLLKRAVSSSNRTIVVSQAPAGMQWTVQDGINWRTFLESETGVRLVYLMKDRLFASAYNTDEDKGTYRQGLVDMYQYTLTRKSTLTAIDIAKEQQRSRGLAAVQGNDPRPTPAVSKPVAATGGT